MTDFVHRLLGRADAAPVRPLLPSRFEPVTPLRDRDLGLAGPDDEPGWEAEPERESVVPTTGWPSIEVATEPAPAKTRPSEKRPTEKGFVEAEKGFAVGEPEEPRPEERWFAERRPVETRPGETGLAKKQLAKKRLGENGLAEQRPVETPPVEKRLVEKGTAEKGTAEKQLVDQSEPSQGPQSRHGGSPVRSWPVALGKSASQSSVPGEESRRVVDPETADLPPRSGFPVEWRRPTASGEESVTAARAARQEPVVHITIGRVEVRAAAEPQPAARRGPRRRQALGLDEYLRRKAGG